MCGIVGYLGQGAKEQKLIQGLKRLEYRGYDSAGIALNTGIGKIKLLREKGNLSCLTGSIPDLLNTIDEPVISGIAHTRWATHGKPNEINAHPHLSQSGNIALVHNGIIENYQSLKNELIKQGYQFRSDTDSEVLVYLIEHHFEGDLLNAVQAALEFVEGTYGIAVISTLEPNKIIAAAKSSPLVIGLAENGTYIASDIAGVVHDTRNIIHMKDYDIAVLSKDNPPEFINLKDQNCVHNVTTIDFKPEDITKGDFEDFMLKEIHDQPETINNATRGRLVMEQGVAKLSGLNGTAHEIAKIKHIVIIASGTSRLAGLVGEYLIEQMTGIPVEVEYASEFRYRNPIIGNDTVVLALSQSGETADTLAALREAKLKGAKVFGIVNSVSSAIAREAGRGVYLHAGPEVSVASTKAFTSQVITLCLLGLLLGRSKRLSITDGQKIIEEINQLPEQIELVLSQTYQQVKKVAKKIKDVKNMFFIGRSYNYPVALEGALKLKEVSYIHAEGYEAAELKHGPIALLEHQTPVLAIMTKQVGYAKMVGTVKEVMARNAPLIILGTAGDENLSQFSDHVLTVPDCPEYLSPILNAVTLQLLAYEVAKNKGLNVDQPRNLAKSVTVE